MHNAGIAARRGARAFVLLAVGVAFFSGVLAGSDERAQMVRALYEDFISHGLWCDADKMSKYFAADLVKDTVRKCDADEEITFAIIPGNDFDDAEVLRTLKVAPRSASTYEARFTNFGEAQTVTYTFEKQRGQWRIINVE
jgi:hypothetical protein